MRRKLFLCCMILLAILYCQRVLLGAADTGPPLPADKSSFYVTGTVCQKDTYSFYLKEFDLSMVIPGETTLSSPQSLQFQNYKLQCTYPEGNFAIGEKIMLRGTFSSFSHATNPGQFDTYAYYQSRRVLGKLSNCVLLYQDGKTQYIFEGLWKLKKALTERIQTVFGENSGVLEAIMLGEKSDMEAEQKLLYKQSGLLHIFSISGLHISFFGIGLYELLQRCRLSKRQASVAALLVLVLYGTMTGGSISAIRAIGMFFLRMLSVWVGRTPDGLTSLGVMAVVVGITEPGCFENSGFYFSFGSVFGICLFLPLLTKKLEQGFPEKGIRKKIGLASLPGISVQLITLPVQAWFLYQVPTHSLVLNLIIVPVVSILFGATLLGLLPGMIPVRWMAEGMIYGINLICLGAEKLPCHMWRMGKPGVLQMVVYYVLLAGVYLFWKYGRSCRSACQKAGKYALPVALLLLCMAWPKHKDLQVAFLDVGQGQCTLIQNAHGQVYLFDCGSSTVQKPGERILIPYLNYAGISTIEKVFLSHVDLDHMNGITELFQLAKGEGITIKEVVLPVGAEKQQELMEAILRYSQSGYSIHVTRAFRGEVFEEREMTIQMMNPPAPVLGKETLAWEDNEMSQVVFVEAINKAGEARHILLLGDVEKRGEEALIKTMKEKKMEEVDVLQVAHHGSGGATTQELLDCFKGKVAVISCAKKNSYGHPNARLVLRLQQAGMKILETRKDGALLLHL